MNYFVLTLKNLSLVLVCLVLCHESYAKVLIITPVYNRPDFIEMQYKTFKKFFKDDYEYKVFNDADNPGMEKTIRETCERLGVTCIRVPQNLHNVDPLCYKAVASFRHGESLQFAFNHSGFKHDDLVILIDSDVFLIHDFSLREFLRGYDIFGYGVLGIFPQLCFFDMPQMPDTDKINFRAAFLENGRFMDVSCFNEAYCHAHPSIKWKMGTLFWGIHNNNDPYGLHIDKSGDVGAQLSAMGYTSAEIKLIKSLLAVCDDELKGNPANSTKVFMDCNIGFYQTNLFVDYKHGSGWHGPTAAIKEKKDKIFKEFMDTVLS